VKWPTSASHFYSSNFGENRDDHFHMGLDIKTNGITGYEVVAVEDGYIHRLVSNYNGYGKALYQMTVSGHEALYAHLESFTPILEKVWHMQQTRRRSYKVDAHFSRREFQVKKGDVIGYTGNTGNSFGPHLHFEYRSSKSEPLNPLTMAFDIPDHVTPIPKTRFNPLVAGIYG
jgi:murein DD-endopeptidase MepM/ murein hydrolase activator NlpD